MGQDLCDGLGVRKERDEREGGLAGGTDQGKDFIDPGQESRPPGGSGRGGIRGSRLCPLRLGPESEEPRISLQESSSLRALSAQLRCHESQAALRQGQRTTTILHERALR